MARVPEARAFIFDFDGTLYDSRRLAFNVVMYNLPDALTVREERRLRKELKGADFQSPEAYYAEFFERLSRRTGKSTDVLRAWYFERYMPNMRRVLEKKYKARPRTLEIFDALKKAGIKYAVYSDYPDVAERLAAVGLPPERCGALYGPDTFGALKPAPRPFLTIAADLQCPCSDILVIGDREDTDGNGAHSCGMRFILVSTPSWDALSGLLIETNRNLGRGSMVDES
ncbi:phosphoglycolate phosphatase [Spirochaetia bacterium]|nr:phosphoglycolate phosphatase [Spirochaetia bacterium]